MLTLEQLTRLREVCAFAQFHADCTYEKVRHCDAELAAKARKATDSATAALADIDAEIEALKGMK